VTGQLQQIIACCSKRYYENHGIQPGRATAHLFIAKLASDLWIGYTDAEPMLLDFISQRHKDADLARACYEVLEHTRTGGGAGVGPASQVG
jgi:hypothetical protein